MTVFDILVQYRGAFLGGLLVTLELFALTSFIGIFFGMFLGWLSTEYKITIGMPIKTIGVILGGIPILVLLFWLEYPFQMLINIVIDPFFVSVIAFSLVNVFASAQIVREALEEFPGEYLIVARMADLSLGDTFLKVELPIIFRQILPSLLTLQINILQLTLFASLISVPEIFRVSQEINSVIYRPIEIYTALAIFFVAICVPLNLLAYWLKVRFTRKLSEK